MNFYLSEVPFSRFGSYMALAELPDWWQGHKIEHGIYLKNVSGSTQNPIVAKFIFSGDELSADLDGGSLSLVSGDFKCDFCFPDPETLIIRGGRSAVLTLDFMTESGPYDYIYEFDADGRHCYAENCYKNNTSYVVWAQEGDIYLEQNWSEQSSEFSRLNIAGTDGFLLIIKETQIEWDRKCPEYDFEACREKVAREFSEFYKSYPILPKEYEEVSVLGAYINWSAYVMQRGFLKRHAMLMSKNHMTNVWSWDHCFNALALSYKNPSLAWEQFMIMFDFQDKSGRLPDSVNDSKVIWNYVKPPIHGWTLKKILENGMTLTKNQLTEAYSALEKQTLWWINYRDFDGDGVCEYVHGNDSGWDNSTVFATVPPIASPDLQAFLLVQMAMLAELAESLGMPQESDNWKARFEKASSNFLEKCFVNGLPTAFQSGTHKVVENQSLLPYLCLILGDRLPKEYRKNMIDKLKCGRFITDHGFATESLDSNCYRPDGYWRGPIWAPSTVILCDGLSRCGEIDLAKETARKFLEMAKQSAFAENYNAVTGEGLRDRAYTWTSSGVFILAEEYLNSHA